jgi:hypothetical protein
MKNFCGERTMRAPEREYQQLRNAVANGIAVSTVGSPPSLLIGGFRIFADYHLPWHALLRHR